MFPNGYTNGFPAGPRMPNGGGTPRGYYVFQAMAPPRQTPPHTQPGQFHPAPIPQPHPQAPFQTMPYPPQGAKPEPAIPSMPYRQPQPVFFPPSSQQQQIKPVPLQQPQREKKALAIVDPNTGKNILDDMNKNEEKEQSSESTASNTPALEGNSHKAEQVDIAAQFAAEVAKKAAEKDEDIVVESVVRTTKLSESSSNNNIPISDSKENVDKLKNSIGNNIEHVNSDSVDSVVKPVLEPMVPNPESKSEAVPPFQQMQPSASTLPLGSPPIVIQQMPPQVAMQQLPPKVSPPQQVPQQIPPLQVASHPPVVQQASPLPVSQSPPQSRPMQLPQAQMPPSQQQPPKMQQQPNQSQAANLANQVQHQEPKSSPPPQASKVQQNIPSQPAQPVSQPVSQPSKSSTPDSAPLMTKPHSHSPSPQPQVVLQPNVNAEADLKVENISQQMAAIKIENVSSGTSSKQNSKPTMPVLSTPVAVTKEKDVPQETSQPSQSKRKGGGSGGGQREESAAARENVIEDNAVPAAQPPQKPASPPATGQQEPPKPPPASTPEVKDKSPEPPTQPPTTTPPVAAVQKPSSLPPSKESTPIPTSPAPMEDQKSERSSNEREVNSAEPEVNNVHDVEEKKEVKLPYSYKDDQWSPVNPDGKRQYDRRFLLELQHNPLSMKKPESLPNLEVVREGPGRQRNADPRSSVGMIGSGPDFTPDYIRPVTSGGRGGGGSSGRNSQHRMQRGVNGPNRGRGKAIIIPLPNMSRESKLKTTENAWKPSVTTETAGEKEITDDVVKRMRGILNKLTPEKFDKLAVAVKQLPIDTTERLSAVIDLIFEKAVDEQGFSSTYASLCQVLSKMTVKGEANEESKSEVKFRNLIITKCQKEFEKDNLEEIKPLRLKEIDICTDAEKKVEMKAKWDYEETKLRQRSVGNIRFIGELYKLRMLTSPIMMRIIGTLLQKKDEESLECLCKLLTTIGKILERQCSTQSEALEQLERHFKYMSRIVSEKQTIPRVRFLMMDVIDLRKNNWIPRREDNKPKTKKQVHEEVKREEIEQQMALANTPVRRDDRDMRERKRSRDNRAPMAMDNEGWNTVASTKNRTVFDSSRLQKFRPGAQENKEVTLRGTSFGNWGRGSSGGALKDQDDSKQQENRFNILADSMGNNQMSTDNRRGTPSIGRLAPGGGPPPRQVGFGSKSMPPPSNDKESALSAVKKFVASDRSKSTSRPQSRDNSVTRENEALMGVESLDYDTAKKYTVSIIEEYAHNADPEEAKLTIKERFSVFTIKHFISHSLEWVIDRDSTKRRRVGQLYHDILKEKLLSFEIFCDGLRDILSIVEDFAIDIPQVYEYLGEIFAPCLVDSVITVERMHVLAELAYPQTAVVLAKILVKAAGIMTNNKVADVWNSSSLSWSKILPPDTNVDEFVAKHKLEFTVDRSTCNKTGSTMQGWDPQSVESELHKLFKRASNAEIFNWIDANIGNDKNNSKFVRALVTALVESQTKTSNDGSSICTSDDFEDKMKNRLNVVRKYVDSSDNLELHCIYALQAISVKYQHPKGFLEKCFNAFYDSEVVSEEAFDDWIQRSDPEEQDGKGVCVASVQSFMRWLRTADVEESETQG